MTERMVLLDRDGTIDRVERGAYVLSPDDLELLPGAGEGLRAMQDLGLRLAIVTNQAPVGRGWIDERQLEAIHDRLRELVAGFGVTAIEGIFVCPHRPEDGCDCRKPEPGLALRAAEQLGFSLPDAVVVGDRAADVELAHRVGAASILVRTGQAEGDRFGVPPDHVTDDLVSAAAIIAELADLRGIA